VGECGLLSSAHVYVNCHCH